MNKRVKIIWKLKCSYVLSIILSAFLLFSCSKDKADVSMLLASVPSSSGGVMGINVGSLLEKAGFEIENGEIKQDKNCEKLLASLPAEFKEIASAFADGSTGVDLSGAILFYDLNRSYLTFGLNDTNAFREYAESHTGEKFSEQSGVSICRNIAVKGVQAWIALNDHRIDPVNISGYASLSESQSFLQNPQASKILEMEHDIYGWGKIGAMTNRLLDFQEATIFNLFTGTLFEDADQMVIKADCEKGEFEAKLTVLNQKGKPAKYMLSADKIDMETLKSVSAGSDIVVAASITPKLLKQVDHLATVMGKGQYKLISEALSELDGTVAIALADPDNLYENISGVATASSDNPMKLKILISQTVPLKSEGKLLKFGKGTMNGTMTPDVVADNLKGACFGIVSDFPVYPLSEFTSIPFINKTIGSLQTYCLKLEPEDGSVAMEIEVKSKDKNENILKTVVKANSVN